MTKSGASVPDQAFVADAIEPQASRPEASIPCASRCVDGVTDDMIEAGLAAFKIGPTGWHATDADSVRSIYRAMDTPPAEVGGWAGDRNELRVRLQRCLLAELGDTYDCTRVWSAWGYGTMAEDDFEPVLDRMDEIIDTFVAAICAQTIEARRAETLGSVEDESVVATPCAPEQSEKIND